MKNANCYNCGKLFPIEDEQNEDYFECLECRGYEVEWSQTE